jgi:hypothetical protein
MRDGLTCTPAQLGDRGFYISGLKQICARHKSIGTGAGTVRTGFVVDAAVHADAVGYPTCLWDMINPFSGVVDGNKKFPALKSAGD